MALETQFLQEMMFAFIKSGLLTTALQLELFTHIAHGQRTVAAIAAAAHADERAIRIVLDALTALGLLTKTGDQYGLDPLVETMLVKDSPAYAGAFTRVTLNPRLWGAIGRLGEIVRTGQVPEAMVDVPEHEFWVEFSEASEGISQIGANAVADQLVLDPARPAELLDVAVGSGVYGFTALERYPRARLTSLDWSNVLANARKVAERRGVADRVTWLPGSAFDTPLPAAHFDAIIMSHFLHHFSLDENGAFLRRLFAALKPGGQLLVHEFVPDDARTAHQPALLFAVIMLATTAKGNAYTLAEYRRLLENAGYRDVSSSALPVGGSTVIAARRAP
jgi:ubiquinone/menaquinone biosynthesis C-methylase UbiE